MLGSLAGAWLAKKAKDRGIGGPGIWMAFSAVGLLRRLYRDKAKRSEVIALAEPIRPGDQLLLTYPGKPGRRTRRELKLDARRREREAAELKRLDAIAAAKRAKWGRSRAGRKATAKAARRTAREQARRSGRARTASANDQPASVEDR